MQESNTKNLYARHVSLFLAELIRTRKTSLDRAAEIAQKVIENINLIDNESHFLVFVKELTLDFDELLPFEERVNIRMREDMRKEVENKVQAYAVHIMTSDLNQALEIMKEGLKEGAQLKDLCQKFPEFKKYIESTSTQWITTRR